MSWDAKSPKLSRFIVDKRPKVSQRIFMARTTFKHEVGIYEDLGSFRKKRFLWKQRINGESFRERFETLAAAKAAKASKLAQVKKYGELATEFNKADWMELEQCRKILPAGVSVLRACEYFVEMHSAERPGGTVAEEVASFLEFQRMRGVGHEHLKSLRTRLNKFCGTFGHRSVTSISTGEVVAFLTNLKLVLKPRTIKNYRSDFSNFFNYLKDFKRITVSPLSGITHRHFPKVKRTSTKNPLHPNDVAAVLAYLEGAFPEHVFWFACQFLLGIRVAESFRFRCEWIDPKQKRVVIPGWYMDGGEEVQGSKTEDMWALDNIPSNFWAWHARYGKASGPLVCTKLSEQSGKVSGPGMGNHAKRDDSDDLQVDWLDEKLRTAILRAGILERWPHNCKRDTFCTCHLSAYRDANATALILKHRNTSTLWESYMGCLLPEWEGRALFNIYPSMNVLRVGVKKH